MGSPGAWRQASHFPSHVSQTEMHPVEKYSERGDCGNNRLGSALYHCLNDLLRMEWREKGVVWSQLWSGKSSEGERQPAGDTIKHHF
ncbi:hypothetical protein Y1Q_0007682 [Alligator mississippiensis]|uniref:Uncharacterized protein n=1 Tax=Alligator mississippiensis TaxID=8496 RepID=A0A151LY78_ALLMI|nr:hypothetical protein Y1Q_0007682 [Alligator mississippiensis]